MSKKSDSTELTVVNPETFPVLADGGNIGEIIRMNMGGEQVSPSDLTRIKIPTGGSTLWIIPTTDGEESAKNLDGVIVNIARRRAYWSENGMTGDPPACSSSDCEVGIGHPGGECELCPYNQFGSAVTDAGTQGRGKACKESKLVFLLREGQFLPEVVAISPGSLKAMREFQFKLKKPYWSFLSRLSLEKATNKDGQPYAHLVVSTLSVLDSDAAASMLRYAQQLQTVFNAVGMERAEVCGE